MQSLLPLFRSKLLSAVYMMFSLQKYTQWSNLSLNPYLLWYIIKILFYFVEKENIQDSVM